MCGLRGLLPSVVVGGTVGGLVVAVFVARRSLIGALPLGGVALVGVRGAWMLLLSLPLHSHRRLVGGRSLMRLERGLVAYFLRLRY